MNLNKGKPMTLIILYTAFLLTYGVLELKDAING